MMSGWSILVAAVVCGFGAMMFLVIVARAVEGCEHVLTALDKAEQKNRRKREQAVVEEEEPVVVEAVKSSAA